MGKKIDFNAEEFDISQMEEESTDLLELRYINKENSVFKRTPGGFVSMEYNGLCYDRVLFYRTFPFTDPGHYISIRESNEKVREIGVIKDLEADVSKEEATMIKEQLDLRYFTPIIKKIYDIKEEYGYAYFNVKTNYGACKFTIQMNGGSVFHLSENRILITDLDGNRFEIQELLKLTAKELKKLDLFL